MGYVFTQSFSPIRDMKAVQIYPGSIFDKETTNGTKVTAISNI